MVEKRDFERAVGETLQVHTQAEAHHSQEVRGTLLAVQPEAIVLQTASGNVTIPFAEIQSAKKSLRW